MRKYNFLHKALFENLDDLNKICELNDIKYVPVGGTYFSAIDIGDIYELDDDMDFIMHQKDILKIKESISKKHQGVSLSGSEGNQSYVSKFFNYKVTLVERNFPNRKRPGGFIDLSPWVPVPKSYVLRQIKRIRILRWRLGMRKGTKITFRKINLFKRIIAIIVVWIAPSKIKSARRFNRMLLKRSKYYQESSELGRKGSKLKTYKQTQDTKWVKYGISKIQMLNDHVQFNKDYGKAVLGTSDPKPFAPTKYSHALKIEDKPC